MKFWKNKKDDVSETFKNEIPPHPSNDKPESVKKVLAILEERRFKAEKEKTEAEQKIESEKQKRLDEYAVLYKTLQEYYDEFKVIIIEGLHGETDVINIRGTFEDRKITIILNPNNPKLIKLHTGLMTELNLDQLMEMLPNLIVETFLI